METEVRDYIESDLDPLSGIYSRAFSNPGTGENWTLEKSRAYLQSFLDKGGAIAKVSLSGGSITGGIICTIEPWHDGVNLKVNEIFVDPDSQKGGAGRLLLSSAVDEAIEKHGVTSAWMVALRNDHPIKWYRKLGFREQDDLCLLKADARELASSLGSKA